MSEIPETLRAAARASSTPVRPVWPPAGRAAVVLALAAAAAAVLVFVRGFRPDAESLGTGLMWFPIALRLAAAAWLLLLAMREGMPGEGPTAPVRRVAMLCAPLIVVLTAEWLAQHGGRSVGLHFLCLRNGLLAAAPAVGVFAWLAARAYPLHPIFAGLAGALGSGLVADAALRLYCPATDRLHALAVHGGVLVVLAIVGALAGGFRSSVLRR